jgi:hypothetical protein
MKTLTLAQKQRRGYLTRLKTARKDIRVSSYLRDTYQKKEAPRIVDLRACHTIPLIRQEVALLIAPQPLTEQNYQHIMATLELLHDALVTPEAEQTGAQPGG